MDPSINHNNDLVTIALLKARISLVNAYRRNLLFSYGEPGRIIRRYHFSPKDMAIDTKTFLKPYSIQPGLEDTLTNPSHRFLRITTVAGLYEKVLPYNRDVTLYVRFYNKQRIEVGYRIVVEPAPVISFTDTEQKDKVALGKFVENMIWLPIVKAHRILKIRAGITF
jgi:hypothetical protein